LCDTFPYGGTKSGIFVKQTQSGLLYQSFGVGAFGSGDLRKLRFLLRGEMYFHSPQSTGKPRLRQEPFLTIDFHFLTNIYINLYIAVRRVANPEAFLPLKPHWFHVLLSLADQEQHGYGIMQEVLDRTAGKVRLWPATLYGTLKRLIDQELIEESDNRPEPQLDDARRRYYRLTKLGRSVLKAESARLEELVRVIHSKRGLARREVES
jgi:DNA-binding PadR family transcriptional regulator